MTAIATAKAIVKDLQNLSCTATDIAQCANIPVDTVQQLIAGKLVNLETPPLRRLARLQRLRHAQESVSELMFLGIREVDIAKGVGKRKETITHILRDPYWSVSNELVERLDGSLWRRRVELFERLLVGLEIHPFQTSGRPTNKRGWTKRAERLRDGLLCAYRGSAARLPNRDFEGIIAKLGGSDDMILIWAKDRRVLLHEANHLVAFAKQKLGRRSKRPRKHKELMRICK